MKAFVIDDKLNLYAEIEHSKSDRTAIPAGYSLIDEKVWGKIGADEDAVVAALGLTDIRPEPEAGNVGGGGRAATPL